MSSPPIYRRHEAHGIRNGLDFREKSIDESALLRPNGGILHDGVVRSGFGQRRKRSGAGQVGHVLQLLRYLVPDAALILVPLDAKLHRTGRNGFTLGEGGGLA
jgi:hypothetical protein